MFLTIFQTLAVFVTSVTSAVPNEMEFYSETVNFLQDVCNSDVSCKAQTSTEERSNSTHDSRCCGFCTCDDRCDERGSCCFWKYSSFEHSRISLARTRFECVRPQYLSRNNTEYWNNFGTWMVTKCAPTTTNTTLMDLCEGDTQSLESITPVTHLSTDTTYRNKFCAFCNGLDEGSPLISWKLEIMCDRVLFVSDKNFLATVRETRCNIFYTVPESVGGQYCRLHEYEISTCNATGLWPVYAYSTELKCNSLVDPFNKTYKNYYCYECNTDTPLPPDQWACRDIQFAVTQHKPEFSAVIDVAAVVPVPGAEQLHCDTKRHFEDYKMMLCRDLLCHESRRLSTDGRCQPISNFEGDVPCYVTFIKVTPLPGYILNSFILERSSLLDNIKKEMQLLFNNSATQFRMYAMTSPIDKEKIDFLVVYAAFSASSMKIAASTFAVLLNGQTIYVTGFSGPESSLPFDLEIRSYETTFDESGPILHVLDENGMNSILHNAIHVHGSSDDTSMCSVVNKLFECTSIEIGFDELRMKIENSVLYIQEKFAIGMKLLKWEYDIRKDNVRICLEDYRPIYDAMPVRPVIRQTSSAFQNNLSPFFALVSVCLSVKVILLLMPYDVPY